jgi:mRNA interferase MazF
MNRGEIWLINLDPTVGSEIKKTRPAVIVNDDAIGILPLKVIVPITEWKDKYSQWPWMVRIEPDTENGLDKLSSADTFQVRSVAQERFVRQLGKLSSEIMQKINEALALVLSIDLYLRIK